MNFKFTPMDVALTRLKYGHRRYNSFKWALHRKRLPLMVLVVLLAVGIALSPSIAALPRARAQPNPGATVVQKKLGLPDTTGCAPQGDTGVCLCTDAVTGGVLYCPVKADLGAVTAGDVLVVGIIGDDPGGSYVGNPIPNQPKVTDTLGSTFSIVEQYDDLAPASFVVGEHVAIFVATLSSSATSDTVTYTEPEGYLFDFTALAAASAAFVFEVSGVTTAGARGAVGVSPEPQLITGNVGTGSSVYFNSGAFLFSIADSSAGIGSTALPALVAGSGFTQFPVVTPPTSGVAFPGLGVEYSTSGAPSPTFFPQTAVCGTGCILDSWYDVGIALEPTSLATLHLSPVSVNPGGGLTLETDFSSVTGCLPNCAYLLFVGVITPSGDTYVCPGVAPPGLSTGLPPNPCQAAFTAGGDTGGCAIPFGVADGMTATGDGISGCKNMFVSQAGTGLIPPWYPVADPSLSSLESDCTQLGSVPGTYSSTAFGSTSEVGAYQVVSCWVSQGAGFFATTPFTVAPASSSVPQFPVASLTPALLVALLLPVLLYQSRKFRPSLH